jgi:AbiV family abortive infection protein
MLSAPLFKAAAATSANAQRLLAEAELLEFATPCATPLYLSLIAQEELAKAFLLYLSAREVIPWSQHILHATKDHRSKQLVMIVLDHLSPDIDTFLSRMKHALAAGSTLVLPKNVSDALRVLRYEKIGRWEGQEWIGADEQRWDREAAAALKGKRDHWKQDALYVRLGRNGTIAHIPNTSREVFRSEFQKAERIRRSLESLMENHYLLDPDFDILQSLLKTLFEDHRVVVT